MDLDLVGYLFGLLDPEDRVRTEAALVADPAVRARLDRLTANLAPLAYARDDDQPPAGLADRTLALVFGKRNVAPSRKPVLGTDRPIFAASRWRGIDVVVAASVLILIGGLGVSGVGHIKNVQARAICENNLRNVYEGLSGFSSANGGRFPQISDRPPNNFAGAFVPMLHAAGYLPDNSVPPCPAGSSTAKTGGYRYSLGFRGPDGSLHGMSQSDAAEADLLALLADPPAGHGDGHNVLYVGGNVRYCTSPFVGVNGDNIFDNKKGQIAAGVNKTDSVLADERRQP